MEHAIPAAGIDSDEDAIVTEGTATAAEQPDSVATTSHAQPAAAGPPAQPQQQGGSGAVWALAAGAVGLGVACLVRWRGNRGKSRRVTVRRDQVYLSLVNQQQPSVALPSTASTCLAGKAFAISDRCARARGHCDMMHFCTASSHRSTHLACPPLTCDLTAQLLSPRGLQV